MSARVLIVEDDQDLGLLLKQYLELNFEVHLAQNMNTDLLEYPL